MAGLSGGYPSHGDTFKNDSDTTEVRWWGKGGLLVGASPERIAYFKSVIEAAPFQEMKPEIVVVGEAEVLENNIYVLADPGSYYLAYVANKGATIELDLKGEKEYLLEVIDTWNMQIVSRQEVSSGKLEYETTSPYTAVRLTPK